MAKYYDAEDYDDGYDDYEDDGVLYDDDGIQVEGGRFAIDIVRDGLGDRSHEVTDDVVQRALDVCSANTEHATEYIFREILDRERIETSCAMILSHLGDDSKYTTVKAIKDSLWHYYYDEDKTLGFISRSVKTAKNKAEAEARRLQKARSPSPSEDGDVASQSGMESVSVSVSVQGSKPSVSKPQSKNLNVAEEYQRRIAKEKKNASFVVVGHVDAGKSTLMGRLLVDMKVVDNSLISQYRHQASKLGKQSFALAWVMDQREEERERGVTIDIATNFFETDKTEFTILDAPGHRDFVPNMIAGASQADFAVLVIDANTGAFERGLKGQTYEHILLLRSLGIYRIIVGINKLDMVGWSQDRYDEITQQVTAFLGKLNFPKNAVQCVPISGLQGTNIVTKPDDNALKWYTGPTLVEALENVEPVARVLDAPMRMMISELVSSSRGKLTIAGRISTGTVQVGDALAVAPTGDNCYVKSIEIAGEARDWAASGDNVSLSLVGVEPEQVQVGDVLGSASVPVQCNKVFTVKALAFESLIPMAIDVHRGRKHSAGSITKLVANLDKATGFITGSRPRVVKQGSVARIQISLLEEIPVDAGQRVVIRSQGRTVAAGVVE